MAKIEHVIRMENKDSYAIVHVMLDDGTEAQIYIGGSVEVFFHKERIKAFVKRNKDVTI